MIEIDGSQKSGSGTIVRDAITYAVLLGQGVRITHIRAQREKPGLRPQHLGVVQAYARWTGANVRGAEIGSEEIEFVPKRPLKDYFLEWDIGTSGSATLFSLAVLPVLQFARFPTKLDVKGGLFQDHAPTALYLQHVLSYALRQMGATASFEIHRPGFIPTGNGEFSVSTQPLQGPLKPLQLLEQGQISAVNGIALSSHLKERNVSDRMAGEAMKVLRATSLQSSITVAYDETDMPLYYKPAPQPGAALCLWVYSSTKATLGADMAGAPRRSSEWIGRNTARQLLQDIQSGATVDRHLADMLIPFAALADGESLYRIPQMTGHIEARLWLMETMLGASWELEGTLLRIGGIGFRP
ncbi:MAG: RNA 3'-terminal phosphate cyclase [candidate division KSB1 bacterium]|nr:RNA 3'-terminal phosphate cyclase [candidate division KSB1 bacterium]